jgi:uncharacterized protein involved in exopolysaccharide biosynthesis
MVEDANLQQLAGLSGNGTSIMLERPRVTFAPIGVSWVASVLLQNWKLIAACTLISFLAVVAALPLMDTRYLVHAKVLVELGREMTAPPTVTVKETAPQVIMSKRPEDLGSEIEIMKSPELMEALVRSFGVDYFLAEPPAVTLWQQGKRLARHTVRWARETFYDALVVIGIRRPVTPFERVVLGLRQALEVDDVRKSDVIDVQLSTSSPEAGVAVLKRYLELFQDKHISVYRSPLVASFFSDEVKRAMADLRNTEDQLQNFKEKQQAWSVAEQSTLLLKTQSDLEATHAKTISDIQETLLRNDELRRQEAALPADVAVSHVIVHDPVDDEMRKQLGSAEAQLAQGSVVFGEGSPQIAQLQRQIDKLRGGIAGRHATREDQLTSTINPRLLEVRREIAGSEVQLAALKARSDNETAQLQKVKEQLQNLSGAETTLYDMQREVGRLDRKYALYTSGLEDSRISEAMEVAKISNVRVISAPVADTTPVWPPLLLILAGGVFVGLGGSVAFVLFRDTIQPVARMPRDVEQLTGLPVLANLPEEPALRASARA